MINELAKQVHQNAKDHGFFDKEKNIGEMLCLIHSEVSEALEADRNERYCVLYNDTVLEIMDKPDFSDRYKSWIKGTFEEEMSDIVIRVMDLCAFKNIDLEAHIKAKMRYNSLREYKHGKKY
jgi:NTP pyrophosphatase (non-canonical NTP hydrolase)